MREKIIYVLDDEKSISWNVISLKILVHDVMKLLYYEKAKTFLHIIFNRFFEGIILLLINKIG